MIKYVYDAWGNHAVLDADGNDIEDTNHIGNINPFRYRGYFYDVETGLYYLQTRYYDPETGRFISQDSTEYAEHKTVNGLNLYAYCGNNPVMNVDPTGTDFLSDAWNSVCEFFTKTIPNAFNSAINWLNDNVFQPVSDFFAQHWDKVLIGALFIIGGALVTAFTGGVGTTFWASFGSALLTSTIQVGASVAISVGLNGLINVANDNHFFDNLGDTIANSFMWSGILVGGAQMLGGGLRFLRKNFGFRGINTKMFSFLSPDKLYYKNPGATLIRIGKFAIDTGKYGLHMHLFSKFHIWFIPIITFIRELLRKR